MAIEYTTGPPVSRPGIRATCLKNSAISDADELLAWAEARLAEHEVPPMEFEIDAADLGRVRNSDYETPVLGETGILIDPLLGIDTTLTLAEIRRDLNNPLRTKLVYRKLKKNVDEQIADLAGDMEDYSGPTEYLPAERVHLPDGGTLDDWVGDDDQIDGGEIQEGTIDRLELARVISRTDTSPEEYTVELLDPATRTPTGTQLTEVFTADNDSDLISTYTEVLVLIRSDAQVTAGEHHVIIRGGGSGTNYYITAPSLTFTGTGF